MNRLLMLVGLMAFGLYSPATATGLDVTFGSHGRQFVNFGIGSGEAEGIRAMARQSNGKIVAACAYRDDGGERFLFVRFQADGRLDLTFGRNGRTEFGLDASGHALSLAVQADDKIVMAGQVGQDALDTADWAVARLTTDGQLDETFAGKGAMRLHMSDHWDRPGGVAIRPDGKIIIGGKAGDGFGVARLSPDGSLDTSFDGDGKLFVPMGWSTDPLTFGSSAMQMQSDGRIVLVGNSHGSPWVVLRLLEDGHLDVGFADRGQLTLPVERFNGGVYGMALQGDGKILLAGETALYGTGSLSYAIALARLRADGSLDSGFDGDGQLTRGDVNARHIGARTIFVQSDGKIVVGGWSRMEQEPGKFGSVGFVLRMRTDG